MSWRTAFRLCFVTVLICACHQKPDARLEEFVAKPVLRNYSTKPLYLADTSVRVSVPSNVSITKDRSGGEWTTESIVYHFKGGDHRLCDLHLSRYSLSEGHLIIRGAKRVVVGQWRGGLWSETKANGRFDGHLLVDVPRMSWAARMWDSVCQKLRILRGNKSWPKDTKEQLKRIKEAEAEGERDFKETVVENLGFHAVHFFYSDLTETDRDLVLEIAASMTVEGLNAFSSTVDWYRPPPDEFQLLPTGTKLPDGLIVGVTESFRNEAVLLGNADLVELTKEQAVHFTSSNPDSVVASLIKKKTEMIQSDRYMAEGLNSEIATLREWEQQQQLKPYLIKAVALKETERFEGMFYSEALVIYQGVMGRRPVPMMRMPVVAFLPKKPSRVYNEVGMMW